MTEDLEEKSGDVVKLLKEAAASKTTIESLGETEAIVKKGQRLYRLLKRCISKECKEARLLVKDIPGKNVWEAWRVMSGRFDPNNDLSNVQVMRVLTSETHWQCKTIMEAAGRIAAWERMQAEFQERTGEVPLSAWSKRQVMLSMLPPQVQEYINVRGHYGQ